MESKAIGIAVSLAFFLFMFGAPAPTDPVQSGVAFSATETDSLAPQIDEIFKKWNRPDSPGGAIVIVKDGRLVFMKGYGCADLENSVRFTPSTKVYMASIAKQFTGYCVARLIQDGKVALNDDIRKHIPEMPLFHDVIQVRHLVYQTSGIRDLYGLLPLTGFRLSGHLTNDDVLKILVRQTDLNFPPGKEWEYSNSNYFLLGEMIKRITGESLKGWAQRNVFDALAMKNTFFVDSIETLIPGKANSYRQNDDQSFCGDPFLDVTVGHTGLYSTAEDLAKWLIHLHDMIHRRDPLLALMLQTDTFNSGETIGNYSFGLFKTSQQALNYWHRGSLFGYKSIFSYYPAQDFGLVIIGNVQTFNRRRYAREVTRLFYQEIAPADPPSPNTSIFNDSLKNKSVIVDASLLKRYEGNYYVAPMTVYVVNVRDYALTLHEVSGSRTTHLVPVAKDQFRNELGSLLITFAENSEGIVDKMIYQSASEKVTGERPVTLSSPQETAFIGEYGNHELEISIMIERSAEGLKASNLALGNIALVPTLADQFRCDHDFFSYIAFYRNPDNSIAGFLLDGFGVRKMKFVRR